MANFVKPSCVPGVDGRTNFERIMNNILYDRHMSFLKAVVCLIFLISLMRYFSDWPYFWDIWLWDETFYMGGGIYTWTTSSFSNYEASPLYSYLYKLVGLLFSDPTELFAVVGVIGSAGAIVSIFLATWWLGGSILLAISVGAVLVLGGFSMSGPRLIYIAICVIMLGGAIGFSLRIFPARAMILALTTFVAAFIRPEFALAFYIFLLFSVVGWFYVLVMPEARRRVISLHKSELISAIFAAIILLLLSGLWSFPIISGGARALMAFGQHFSLYWANVNGVNIDAFLNWENIIGRELPGVDSEFLAILRYPEKMLAFFVFNILSAIEMCGRSLLDFLGANYAFSVALCLVAVVILRFRSGAPGARLTEEASAPWWHDVVLWLALAFPVLVSIVLIYARAHYLVIFISIFALGVSLVVRRIAWLESAFLAALLSCVLLFSTTAVPAAPRPNFDVVTALKKHGNLGRLLELDGGWCFYIPERCVSLFMVDIPKEKNFLSYLDEGRIDSIVVSKTMLDFVKVNRQQEFLDFLTMPKRYGWKKTPLTPNTFLLTRVSGREPARGGMLSANLMNYVADISLGDDFGNLHDKGDMTFFVHPGRTAPTIFEFKSWDLASKTGCKTVSMLGKMDGNVPVEASGRGAAKVGMRISRDGKSYFSSNISVSQPKTFTFSPSKHEVVVVLVDNAGNPDTDWLNIQVRLSACEGVRDE